MDRKAIYEKTAEFLKGRWLSITLISLGIGVIVYAINVIVGFVLGGSGANQLSYEISNGNISAALNIASKISSGNIFTSFFISLLDAVLSTGLSIAVLNAYRNQGNVVFNDVVVIIKEHFEKIIIAILAITAITTLIGLIPFVGTILASILNYCFAFAYFLINDKKSSDAISAIKDSYESTTGHKLNMFMIDWYYILRILIGFGIIIIAVFFANASPALAILLMFVGAIVSLVLLFKYLPYLVVARVIYYETVQESEIVDI
jgi:Protein of unknown function (DUF975).